MNPNDDLTQGLKGRDFKQERELQFEQEVLSSLLTKFKLTSMRRELAKEHERNVGQFRATLDEFCHTFYDFPLYLQARVIPGVGKKESVSKLFQKFTDTSIVRYFEELLAVVGEDGRPAGMIFSWPFVPLGLIIHNSTTLEHDGVSLTWKKSNDQLVITTWSSVLHNLAWQPVV